MQHIQNFLDIYRSKHKDFSCFPKVLPQTVIKDGVESTQYLNELELLEMYLAIDELILYSKDFLEDKEAKDPNFKNYISLMIEENKDWISTQYKNTTLSLEDRIPMDFALSHPSRFVFNNIKNYYQKDVSIEFSSDLKSYEITTHYPEPEDDNGYPNPFLFYHGCVALGCVPKSVYERTQYPQIPQFKSDYDAFKKHQRLMEFFALSFKENLIANEYQEKNAEEKIKFLFKNVNRVFEHAQYCGALYENPLQKEKDDSDALNKSDFKLIVLLALLEHYPEFIIDLNKEEMIKKSIHVIEHVSHGYPQTFLDYFTNYESNPFINISIENDRSSDKFITVDTCFNFFDKHLTDFAYSNKPAIYNEYYKTLVQNFLPSIETTPFSYHFKENSFEKLISNGIIVDPTLEEEPFFQAIQNMKQRNIPFFSKNSHNLLFKLSKLLPIDDNSNQSLEDTARRFAVNSFKHLYFTEIQNAGLNELLSNEHSSFLNSIMQNFDINSHSGDTILKAFELRDFDPENSIYKFNQEILSNIIKIYPGQFNDIKIFREALFMEINIPINTGSSVRAKKF